MSAVRAVWRARRRRPRRMVVLVALAVGALGGVALASFGGARRTASTFARYERDVQLSDVAVNTFVPDLQRVDAIAREPGVRSSATYVGLNAFPVLHGRVVMDFRYTGVFGSLDGRFFTQDRATVIEGRLPGRDRRREIALSPRIAALFGVSVGDWVEYRFDDLNSKPLGQTRYRVVGIVQLPPVVVDENDIIEGAVLPPAATHEHLDSLVYAWQGLRLARGSRGLDAFLDRLRSDPAVNQLPLVTQNYGETRVQAQRSIRPQAVALAVFGAAAALSALALGGLGLSRIARSWSDERFVLRAVGLTRRHLASVVGIDEVRAIASGIALAALVCIALSPLAPFGQLRDISPDTGFQIDLTVVLGAGGALALILLAIAAFVAWAAASSARDATIRNRPSVVVASARRMGFPLCGVLGTHFALDRNKATHPVPLRATLLGSATATLAVVAALVFGASLQGLVSDPQRYGWAWDRMLIAEAGFGNLKPSVVQPLVDRERAVTGWSLLAFHTVSINGRSVPALGLGRRVGHVEPPVVSGRAVAGAHEIALGTATLRQLGRHVGDHLRVGADGRAETFKIVGAITFPSIGQGGADHTSLGRGALLSLHGLASLASPGDPCGATETAICPQALVFDVAPGADGTAIARRIAAADPDGTPGGTYEQPVTRSADIRNSDEMASYPVALAALLGLAAALAFAITIGAAVRARRHDLAVLRALGLSRRQLRTTIITQSLTTVAITLAIGLPLGIAAGRLTWNSFAHNLGVVAPPTVPILAILTIAGSVVVLSVLFSLIPSAAATRAHTAHPLRTE